MLIKQKPVPIKSFNFEGRQQPVSYAETLKVGDGVDCDVYLFNGDAAKDLGIIRISPGCKTPLQKVLKGDKTIEGYLSGKGKLTITEVDGGIKVYPIGEKIRKHFSISVKIGELMQWEADENSGLVAYEICFPPYKNGRYEDIR